MNKQQFLNILCEKLSGLPGEDIVRSLDYYSEIIDDRIEDGLDEEEAVKAVGSIEEIVANIIAEISPLKLVKERVKTHKSLRAWEIVLLILGAPLWLPLILAAVIIILSLYIVIWSVVVSLYAVVVSLGACGLGGVLGAIPLVFSGYLAQGIVFFGIGLVSIGLTILMALVSNLAAKGVVILTKKALIGVKSRLLRKGDAE